MALVAFLGTIIHCIEPFTVEIIRNGFVIVNNTKIIAVGNTSEINCVLKNLNIFEYETVQLKQSQFLMPGLIDTHIHSPQYPNIGLGYDLPLLEWLEKYTYTLEKKYRDLEFSKKVYEAVVKKTISFGTTTACYFGSLFTDSNLVLADEIIKQGQRAFVGKVNMMENAPEDYVETSEETINNTLTFIESISEKKCDNLKSIITPRFALSCDLDVMSKLGKIAADHDLNIQTHIAENWDETQHVSELYGTSYAKVYDNAGLLTNKTVLAHGIYLSTEEMKLLAEKGTSISHCPNSNTRLASGLCNVKKLLDNGVNVALGTDVSGGSSASIIQSMRNALDVSIHLSFLNKNTIRLKETDVFYMATMGGAKALALDDKIGNFQAGKDFDALLIDMDVENSSADLIFDNYTAEELLHKFIYLGDDRNVKNVYVSGKLIK